MFVANLGQQHGKQFVSLCSGCKNAEKSGVSFIVYGGNEALLNS